MKQNIEIKELSNVKFRQGTTKWFLVGAINKKNDIIMVSEAVRLALTALKAKPEKAVKFILEECLIQIDEHGKMIVMQPKLGEVLFSFSGTLRK